MIQQSIYTDINSGKIKWMHPTEFATAVSPAVTNGIVSSGHMVAIGKYCPTYLMKM